MYLLTSTSARVDSAAEIHSRIRLTETMHHVYGEGMLLLRQAERTKRQMGIRAPRSLRALCELLSNEIGECLDLLAKAALRRNVILRGGGAACAELSPACRHDAESRSSGPAFGFETLCADLRDFQDRLQDAELNARASKDREMTGIFVDLLDVARRLDSHLELQQPETRQSLAA